MWLEGRVVWCILAIVGSVLAEKSYYDILGVSKTATQKEIKKAFR